MLPLRLVPMLMLILGAASPLLAQVIERPPTGYRSPTIVSGRPVVVHGDRCSSRRVLT